MAELFSHPQGVLYFDLYWHDLGPDRAFHILNGVLEGEGPWKIDGHIITVLGCEGVDPELSSSWSEWQATVQSPLSDYPEPEVIRAIARRFGFDQYGQG
jgi:hypothetical protein